MDRQLYRRFQRERKIRRRQDKGCTLLRKKHNVNKEICHRKRRRITRVFQITTRIAITIRTFFQITELLKKNDKLIDTN